jgi:hypothetical protein
MPPKILISVDTQLLHDKITKLHVQTGFLDQLNVHQNQQAVHAYVP